MSVEREVAGDWIVQSEGAFVVALDPTLTDDLRQEGLARELVNRVQRMRKEAGLEYTDRIALWVDGAEAVRARRARTRTTCARRPWRAASPWGSAAPADLEQRHDLDGFEVVVALRRA